MRQTARRGIGACRFLDSLRRKALGSRAQMTVELCVIFPVLIAIALVMTNALAFFDKCAQFDRISRNAVRVIASSISESQSETDVASDIVSEVSDRMDSDDVTCDFSGSLRGDSLATFEVGYSYFPTLFGMDLRSQVFGVALPCAHHSIRFSLDSYAPGKWLWTYAL